MKKKKKKSYNGECYQLETAEKILKNCSLHPIGRKILTFFQNFISRSYLILRTI